MSQHSRKAEVYKIRSKYKPLHIKTLNLNPFIKQTNKEKSKVIQCSVIQA